MDEPEDSIKPVLVRKRRASKEPESDTILPPDGEKNQDQIQSTSPPGEPDHSLVPTPRKRLMEPTDFFRFWRSIPERERNAWFIVYPYRKLPVCDPLQPLSVEELRAIERKQKKRPETNCGKLSEPFDPENWEQQVYQWKGAGDYHLRLNDTHPSVKGTICETSIRGLRDWDNFPPVLELSEVVLDEPLNQPYIRWARIRGIKFPGDPGAETIPTDSNEEDMANIAAVEKLTDALVESTRRQPQVVQAPPAPIDRSNEILADAALKGQQILLDSVKAQTKAQDPNVFHSAIMEAAKAMAPPASNGPSLTEIMGMFTSMMAPIQAQNAAILAEVRSRAESAERRADAAEARAQAAMHPPTASVNPEVANPVKNAIDLLKGLASLKDTAGSLLGGESTDEMPAWARIGGKLIDALPNLVYNAAVMKNGGTPAAPGELNPEVIQAEAQPQQEIEGGQTAQTAQTSEEPMNWDKRIAEEVAKPLIDSLNRRDHGFQFAAGMMLQPKILGFPGRVVYEMAISEGYDGMMRIVKSHPPLWEQLTLIPKHFDTFLKEFLDREAAENTIENARRQQNGNQASPAPESVTPEVLPPEKKGRTIIDPATGQPLQTVKHQGPVVAAS